MRHFGPEQGQANAARIVQLKPQAIGSPALAWAATNPLARRADYKWAFDCAREAGIAPDHARRRIRWSRKASVMPCAIWAWSGSVTGFAPSKTRILLRELMDREVTLEVCPGSNVVLGVFPEFAGASQSPGFGTQGVKVTVSQPMTLRFSIPRMRREYEMLNRGLWLGGRGFRSAERNRAERGLLR